MSIYWHHRCDIVKTKGFCNYQKPISYMKSENNSTDAFHVKCDFNT